MAVKDSWGNPIQEYSLHIFRCASVNTVLSDCWPDIEQELNLHIKQYNELYDWCVKEIFSRILAPKRIKVIGHYRWDEGRCVVDTHMQTLVEFFNTELSSKIISKWKNMEVKMMIFGSDVMIGRPV